MKLKEGFITHDSDGEHIMVAVNEESDKFHGLVRSNKTAAFIIECLKQESTEEQIVDKVMEKYDAAFDTVKTDVHRIIETLRSIQAIHE